MKAVVLLSGGIDSTTCLGIAVDRYGNDSVTAVSVFYGQKHKKELECAEKIAKYYGVRHCVLDLSEVLKFSTCPLLAHSTEAIKHKSYADQIAEDGEGMVSTYVPFRNGLMMAAVASLASSLFPKEPCQIFIGAHADDAAGNAYADCSIAFTEAMNSAINIGTYGNVSVEAPLVRMNKSQVVAEGLRLKVPYELTWSCYEGGEIQCGTCGTCIDRKNAFKANGVIDPVAYKE